MNWLIWMGVLVTLAGLVLLFSCILKVAKAKRRGAQGEDMAKVIQSVVPLNLVAMGLSGIGLMMVVAGIVIS